eukprot:scaffold88107_cov67-Phaeocystis_antarctica.AAC.7
MEPAPRPGLGLSLTLPPLEQASATSQWAPSSHRPTTLHTATHPPHRHPHRHSPAAPPRTPPAAPPAASLRLHVMQAMYDDLAKRMEAQGWDVAPVAAVWASDLSQVRVRVRGRG